MSVFHRPQRFRSYPGGNFSDTGGTFTGTSIDVAIKRQNTMRQIRACYGWRKVELPIELFPDGA
jgi:hypothetical protein